MSMESAQALVIFAGSHLLKVSSTMDSKFFIGSCKGAYSSLAWHAVQQSAHFGNLFMYFRPPGIPEICWDYECNLGTIHAQECCRRTPSVAPSLPKVPFEFNLSRLHS